MFHWYSCPDDVGWLGWFEDADGSVTAFVGLDRKVLFRHEVE